MGQGKSRSTTEADQANPDDPVNTDGDPNPEGQIDTNGQVNTDGHVNPEGQVGTEDQVNTDGHARPGSEIDAEGQVNTDEQVNIVGQIDTDDQVQPTDQVNAHGPVIPTDQVNTDDQSIQSEMEEVTVSASDSDSDSESEGSTAPKRRRCIKYSDDQKKRAVDLMNAGVGSRTVAREIGPHCSGTTTARWHRKAQRQQEVQRLMAKMIDEGTIQTPTPTTPPNN